MDLERFFEVSQAPDRAVFERRLVSMAADMGFGLISGALIVEDPLSKGDYEYHEFGNTPEEYIETSFDKDAAARDPVLKGLKQLSVPFCYSQALYLKAGAIDVWEEQAAFGYRNGICVALHLPDQKHFLLGVDREEDLPKSGAEISRIMANLQLLAVHAQSAAVQILAPAPSLDIPEFTPREVEILGWTREGKSAWEVGQILGISEQGVNYHFRSILQKLDVQSKHQAVLKAIRLRAI